MFTRALLLGLATLFVCAGQYSFDVNVKEQCIAIVPLQGRGTVTDPVRPMFVPAGRPAKRDPKGIEGYSWRLTDDKKSALVIFTASNRAAFDAIVRDPRVKVLCEGKGQAGCGGARHSWSGEGLFPG